MGAWPGPGMRMQRGRYQCGGSHALLLRCRSLYRIAPALPHLAPRGMAALPPSLPAGQIKNPLPSDVECAVSMLQSVGEWLDASELGELAGCAVLQDLKMLAGLPGYRGCGHTLLRLLICCAPAAKLPLPLGLLRSQPQPKPACCRSALLVFYRMHWHAGMSLPLPLQMRPTC